MLALMTGKAIRKVATFIGKCRQFFRFGINDFGQLRHLTGYTKMLLAFIGIIS
jgi:hypothetical protein